MTLNVTLETGPKGKKAAAVAADWPGLERGGKTGEAAVEALRNYLPRYARIAELAGLGEEFDAGADVKVVEEYEGPASTDFWGISFGFSSHDRRQMSEVELERELSLLQACWSFFDDVRGRVSAEMRKGPRGGGRDRDVIVRHVVANEQDWAKKIGVRVPLDAVVTDDEGLRIWREDFLEGIRVSRADGRPARNWPLRYLIRHTAYHVLDHAWEMEDKDLTGVEGTARRR